MKLTYGAYALSMMVSLLVAPSVSAQTAETEGAQELEGFTLGLVAGYNTDFEAPLFGIDARYTFYAAPSLPLSINPGVNYFPVENAQFFGATVRSTVLQFDLNILGNLELEAPITPYAGLGPAVIYSRSSVDSSDGTLASDSFTELGFNLLLGATVHITDSVSAFGQFRMTFWENNSPSLMAGVSYRF